MHVKFLARGTGSAQAVDYLVGVQIVHLTRVDGGPPTLANVDAIAEARRTFVPSGGGGAGSRAARRDEGESRRA